MTVKLHRGQCIIIFIETVPRSSIVCWFTYLEIRMSQSASFQEGSASDKSCVECF